MPLRSNYTIRGQFPLLAIKVKTLFSLYTNDINIMILSWWTHKCIVINKYNTILGDNSNFADYDLSVLNAISLSTDKGKEYSALTCGNDHLVKIWKLTLWKKSASSHQCAVEMLRSLRGHSSTVTSVCFDDSGLLFASTSMDKTTRLWQVLEKYYNRYAFFWVTFIKKLLNHSYLNHNLGVKKSSFLLINLIYRLINKLLLLQLSREWTLIFVTICCLSC